MNTVAVSLLVDNCMGESRILAERASTLEEGIIVCPNIQYI